MNGDFRADAGRDGSLEWAWFTLTSSTPRSRVATRGVSWVIGRGRPGYIKFDCFICRQPKLRATWAHPIPRLTPLSCQEGACGRLCAANQAAGLGAARACSVQAWPAR